MTFFFFFFRLALEKDEIPESKSEEAWKGNQKAQLSTWCIRPYGFMSRNITFKTTYVPFIVCFGNFNPCFTNRILSSSVATGGTMFEFWLEEF